MEYRTVNPRTGRQVGEAFAKTSRLALQSISDDAVKASASWGKSSTEQRQTFCRKAADALRANGESLAEAATLEMGKLRHEASAEVEKCAELCHYYAERLPAFRQSRKQGIDSANAYVSYEPLGVILGIMPWNFPYWQAIRFAIPAIAAGNVTLLKHAPNVPKCAELLVDVLRSCVDLPLIQNLRLSNEDTEALICDDRIAGVSLTGSAAAGRKVGAAAGAALKPSVLELGGSDPYLILADAELDTAVEACFAGRRLNAGQSCISAKRLIVDASLASEFQGRLLGKIQQLAFATTDPTEDGPNSLAPMARADLREQLHQQVTASITAGAKCLCGGTIPGTPSYYYPATLLTEVRPGMPAFDEELFGPVFVMITANGAEDAIRLANLSSYGLGAAVFSRDLAAAEEIASNRLRAGACFVNDFVRSDPRLPFGGVGVSGYGRELAVEGYRAFCNVKTVYVRHPDRG